MSSAFSLARAKRISPVEGKKGNRQEGCVVRATGMHVVLGSTYQESGSSNFNLAVLLLLLFYFEFFVLSSVP